MTSPAAYIGPVPVVAGYVPYLTRLTVTQQIATGASQNLRELTVPQGHWWRVLAGVCQFITSAVVGDRAYSYVVQDVAGADQVNAVSPATIPASAAPKLSCGPFLSGYANMTSLAAGGQQFPIPDLLWPAGYKVRHFVNGSAAGDQYGANPAPTFLIEDYVLIAAGQPRASLALPLPLD